jgi:hypothetical protein
LQLLMRLVTQANITEEEVKITKSTVDKISRGRRIRTTRNLFLSSRLGEEKNMMSIRASLH